MRLAAVATALSFSLSVLSLEVLTPSTSQGWTNVGPQELSWTWNANDAVNFTVLLTNPDTSYFANSTTNQILDALVVANQSQIPVNPPSGGWPTGTNFTVYLVKDTNNLGTVYAKSSSFNISSPSSNTTSSVTAVKSTPAYSTSISTPTPGPVDGGNTGSAAITLKIQSGFFALFTALGLVLAY